MATDVLIISHPQVGYVNRLNEHVIDPLSAYLRSWLAEGRPAVLTRYVNTPGSFLERFHGITNMSSPTETAFFPSIEATLAQADADVLVTEHAGFTALTPEARAFLAERGATRALIAGVDTDSEVLMTALDLFESTAIEPVVLGDLVGSHTGDTYHQVGLTLIARHIGRTQVRHSRDVALQDERR